MSRSKEHEFRVVNKENKKKVDIFYNNDLYTEIMLRNHDSSIKAMEIGEDKRGDNLRNLKLFSVEASAFSASAYLANQCYDMDRRNTVKSFTKSEYKTEGIDNNVSFKFDVGVRA